MKKMFSQQLIGLGVVIAVLAFVEVWQFWLWPTGVVLYIIGLIIN